MDPLDPADLAIVDHILTTTRAARRRLDLGRPVDPAVVRHCIEIAAQSPTGGNSQGWRWLVVSDPATRAALADIYRRAGEAWLRSSEVSARERGDEQTARVYSSAVYLAEIMHKVPVLVIPCVYGRAEAGSRNPAGLYGSIFPAVWSFMLAARARGLGTTLTTVHLKYEQEAADLLGIPDGVSQVALIPVGHVTGTDFKPATRPAVEDIIFTDRWTG